MKKNVKYIEYEIRGKHVVITKQSNRCASFGRGGCCYWNASNGMVLESEAYPAYSTAYSVFVRGSETEYDLNPIKFRTHDGLNKFIAAVDEYNRVFGPRFIPVKLPKELFEIE